MPPPPSPSPSVRGFPFADPPAWALAALVFLATLLAYFPTLRAGFVWNDSDYVTRASLRSLHGLWRIWFEVGSTEQHYPLLHGAFWFEHRLWGDSAAGYHLANILLHAGSACLFALILRRLAMRGAWLAGFIFALHPVCVESVAWISEQKNTLSTFLYLAAALAYLRYDDERRPHLYRLALVLFILALLGKSLTATLPAALLVVLWWRRGALDWRRDVVPLLPWFVVGAAMGIFSAWVEHTVVGAAGADFDLTPVQRFLVAGRAIWFYLGHTLWPANLVFIYPRWNVNPASAWQWLFPAAVIAATAVLWRLRRRWRAPLAAWLFFTGSLFPVMGFFSLYAFRYSFVADHWQYLPMLGVVAFAAGAAARLPEILPRLPVWLPRAAAVLLLVALGTLTRRATAPYHDIVVFYRTIIARNPACWMAYSNLGNVFLEAGNDREAAAQFVATLRLKPDAADAHSNLGDALLKQNLLEAAIIQYRQALQLNPNLAETHNNLASASLRLGRVPDALEHYQRALAIDPDYPEAHCNFGYLLTQFGQPQAAIEHLQRALFLRPRYPEAHDNLGTALLALGRIDEAIRSYREALRLKPDFDIARNNLGNAFVRAGRTTEAIAQYEEILRRDPANTDARVNLSNALSQVGRTTEAIAQLEETLRQRPDLPEAHNNLGFILLRLGRTDEAIARFRQALALRPDYAEARNNLALAQQHAQRSAPP